MQMLLQVLGTCLLANVVALKYTQPVCKDRMRGGFSYNIMRHHCGFKLASYKSDVTETASACEDASTPFLKRALANKMFSLCGDTCVWDFEQPDAISFVYDATQKCYTEKRDGSCAKENPSALATVKNHKSMLCGKEEDLCHPFVPELTENVILRYCGELGKNGQDHSPDTVACDESDTPAIRKALANHMFHHCGAWCLFDYDEPDSVSYAWDIYKQCWRKGGCIDHPEQKYAVQRRLHSCEFTTTTTTSTSTSTSTTITSTTTSTTTTSTSTTTTSTSTSTSTTSTTTTTSTSTTTTSTVTTTTTTWTSTTTSTTTTSTSTVTSTTTTTTTTSTSTTTTVTTTSTTTTSTTTSTFTTTTTTSTVTSTTTTTTTTSTVTSTTTTTTTTSTSTTTTTTFTSTTTTTTSTTTSTITSTTTTSTSTITSTTTTTTITSTTTTTTTCRPVYAELTNEVTLGYCKTTTTNFVDRSVNAKSCDGSTDGWVKRALANGMYNHCDSWCLFDWEFPEKISYHWNNGKKCFEFGAGGCQGCKEQAQVVTHKDIVCEAEKMCTPVAPMLTEVVMKRYCDALITGGVDRSPKAKGCHQSYTPYVQRSLANKMFSSCGAFCLYDYDLPDSVAYSWNSDTQCWQRGSGCLGNSDQKMAVERKATFCEAELCIPVQSVLSVTVMESYCASLPSEVDFSGHAKTCESRLSPKVHKALANKMFTDCKSDCVFDFDEPDKVSYKWNTAGKCWKTAPCGCAADRQAAIARKSKFCTEK